MNSISPGASQIRKALRPSTLPPAPQSPYDWWLAQASALAEKLGAPVTFCAHSSGHDDAAHLRDESGQCHAWDWDAETMAPVDCDEHHEPGDEL